MLLPSCPASLCCALTFVSLCAVSTLAIGEESAPPKKLLVYFGTYTGGKSQGIYQSELDLASGALTPATVAAEVVSPSFLAIHPSRRFLYAVNEAEIAGKKGGAVSGFALDPRTGQLTLLNQQSSGGAGPCHLVVDSRGKSVLVANYGGGSVASLPIGDDGKLGPATSFIQHKGTSVDPKRQEAPHGHSINLDAANRYAVAADLGLDQVLVYKFDAAQGTLAPNDPPFARVASGAGPRHFAFHPTGRFGYVINEMGNTVTAFAYDAEHGILKEIQSITTLPEDFKGTSYTAEVQVHPTGKFLYGSNRGHDSLAIYTIDPDSGRLTAVGFEKTGGKTPRNFGIDPTGTYVLACNQASDNVVVFRVDQNTGELKPTGHTLAVPAPVCVKMLPW
jgi:6-phosphogluconolactonase